MDCEKVRDRFSSLWEKELMRTEEKKVREHLSSCPECRKEWGRLEKTMRWLHSVEEVEIPEGFLPELHKKMEERKSKTFLAEKARGRWLNLPFSLKLPVQAVAMVAIIFLVLYLTKMMPIEGDHMKDSKPISSPPFAEKKSEQVFAQKEMEKERRAMEIPLKAPRPEDVEHAEAPVPGKKKLEGTSVPQVKVEAPSSKTEVAANQTIDSKAAAGLKVPSPEPKEIEKGLTAKDKFVEGSKPLREIVLRISDQKKAISLLHELVRQFEGEIVTSEGNMILASLPSVSFSEFENELVELNASIKAEKIATKEPGTGSLRGTTRRKKEEVDEKSRRSSRPAIDQENRTVVRILLIQE
jgi:hypothetical protein